MDSEIQIMPSSLRRRISVPQQEFKPRQNVVASFSTGSDFGLRKQQQHTHKNTHRVLEFAFLSSNSSRRNGSLSSIRSLNSRTDLLEPLCPSSDSTDVVLPVECGLNGGLLDLSKLCQGSKGRCILYQGSWLTPNEFQLISGRLTAKDWKRSIRHNGKSLKLLISKGALTVHSPLCGCGNHQQPQQEGIRGMEVLDQVEYKNGSGLNNHHHKVLTTMTTNRSSSGNNKKRNDFGIKRETRLTSIIDSLLVSKAHEDEEDPPPQSLENSMTMNSSHPPVTTTSTSSTSTVPPPTTKSRTSKKQRVPPIKTERQSPESVRSSPSPSKPSSNGGGSRGPSPPLRQMEQMMGRNYSDFMRSLAAKYNHANPNELYGSARSSPFNFDSRFLKPGAAAAAASLLAFQQQHGDKLQFPLIDMSSTQTLLSMVRSAAASGNSSLPSTPPSSNGLNPPQPLGKRASSPLDLSSAAALVGLSAGSPPKKSKSGNGSGKRCGSNCSGCSTEGEGIVSGWTVDDVCRFVGSIDLCAEYSQAFRDHSIDGSSLPLLTEEHLMQNMSMKLGPALKFKSTVAKKLGNCPVCRHCAHCHLPAEK